jgi:hypothetical protein
MCAEGKAAMEQRREAVHRLIDACNERCRIGQRLRLVYPPQAVPNDLLALALRIGGQA